MHVLTEFRCKHFVSISLKLFGFLVPAQQLLWWYPGQHLASSSYIHYHFLSRGVAFLVWVKKTCWTKYLHRDFKLVRKVCVYLRNILNNFADWKRKCIPASILICFGYWKHWDCLICSSNLWQQMSTHLVWWTSLSNTNTFLFCFGVSELKTKPSPCSDTNIYPSPLFGVIQRHCISCLSFTIPFANKVIKTHRCLETSK